MTRHARARAGKLGDSPPLDRPLTRTAIISVHGVGGPPQFATARDVADLLMQYGSLTQSGSIDGATPVTYPRFTEQFIKVPTTPLVIPLTAGGKAAEPPPAESFIDRLRQFTATKRDRTEFDPDDALAMTDVDVAFMRDQLAGYESGREPYDTIEIVGTRAAQSETGPVSHDVHIYEMHWSDLSRIGSGPLRFFGALYQLVLHIAHLGRKTLDLAAQVSSRGPTQDGQSEAWQAAAYWHAWVLRVFTVGVPVFTLLLVACFIMFLPEGVAPGRRMLVGTIMLGVIIVTVVGCYAYFRKPRGKPTRLLIAAIIAVMIAIVLANILAPRYAGGDLAGTIVLFFATLLVALGAYVGVINSYDSVVPGALPYGLAGLVIVAAGAVVWGPGFARSAQPVTGEGLRFAALAGLEFSYLLLMLVWTMVWLLAGVAAWHMFLVKRRVKNTTFRPHDTALRTRRAVWTAKVTLSVTLFAFVMTALVSYRVINELAWRLHSAPVRAAAGQPAQSATTRGFNVFPLLREGERMPVLARAMVPPETECPSHREHIYDPAACAKQYFDAFITLSGTAGLPVALITAGVCLILISWFVILVAVTSVREPKSVRRYAQNVGLWITDGFDWVHNAGTLLVWGLGAALTLGLVTDLWINFSIDYPLTPRLFLGLSETRVLLGWMATTAGASVATIAAARASFSVFATSARPAVGIALDVDNYLREKPEEDTPRARIAERFGSLLSYIANRRDDDGLQYFERILIVSHSQGTVIAADFLRFLTLAGVSQPDLSAHDVRLITMGSPLRQLYAVHFPHLYDWIDRTDDYGDGVTPDDDRAVAARNIPTNFTPGDNAARLPLDELSPSPGWLRVSQWVNLYTAGDYVGRPLWQRDDTQDVWEYDDWSNAALGRGRRERCLGDGTHTRYWTSCDVAQEIDGQIA